MKGDDREIRVGFVGNPNCGKTTLFNAVTGSRLKVANWPGVTVERIEGNAVYEGCLLRVVDTPGIYSLTSYTIEEKVTRACLEEGEVDIIVNVLDASSLERNLYLTLQLLEFGIPVILALNMMDLVEAKGITIDIASLSKRLGGIPVIPVSAREKIGITSLLHAVVSCEMEPSYKVVVPYTSRIESRISKIEKILKSSGRFVNNPRWYAVKLLEQDSRIVHDSSIDFSNVIDQNYEKEIINQKYEYIEKSIKECVKSSQERYGFTDRVDQYMTHPFFGIVLFFGIMALVFFFTFVIGDFLKEYFETALAGVSLYVNYIMKTVHVSPWLISLVVDGVIAGVGGILTFLPNIFILFLFLAFLEDSGYMARVAYVMDEIMGKVGLSGKAFLPMILGFGCTVPAVMAARALPSERDRKRTILITPFMSCSAKLPIYVLFSGMFFPRHGLGVAYSLYLIGLLTAIGVAYVTRRIDGYGEGDALLIELPEYKMPDGKTVALYVWDKIKDYLDKAGTTIFLASMILWFLLKQGPLGLASDPSESFAAMFGRGLVPVLAPAGLGDWRIAVALISGLSAKEVVVSSFSVLFGIGNVNSASGMRELMKGLGGFGFGSLNAYAFMIFCLLYSPCIAAVATIKKETGSVIWTAGLILFQLLLAWLASVFVFQTGTLILTLLR